MDRKTVKKVAELACLELDEEHLSRYAAQIHAILEHFESLQALQTEDVEPSVYAIEMEGRTRPDQVEPGVSRESLLSNAPKEREGFYVVPRVIE